MTKLHFTLAVSALALSATSLLALPSAHAATPTCFGEPATVVGTDGPDYLVGGPDDVVFGGPGKDLISGGVACGGSRHDWVFGYYVGGAGHDDRLNGGRDGDWVNGNFGVDTLFGGRGHDTVTDTPGEVAYPDRLDPGVDIMHGGPGGDGMFSTSGSDRVYGDAGDDGLYGITRASTWLYGGSGRDFFYSTADNCGSNPLEPDFIFGGPNWDKATVDQEPGVEDVVSTSTERVIVKPHGEAYCP